MKNFFSLLSATILIGAASPPARAAVELSVDFFHENLEAYGDWREVGDYGYCWQPRDVDADWQPYSDGRWLYTDAGWTWDSEEPYSWAVYHYGRWARVDRVGWVWVPGTEWGPAWVSWRRSERHVGWAPLPPEARFNRADGFSARVDVDFDIGPSNYRFVAVNDFGSQRLRRVMVEPRQNITIIQQTTNITRITYVNNVVYNQGPQYEVIARQSSEPIRRLRLARQEDFDGNERAARPEQLRARVDGDSFRVQAHPFSAKPATAPRKVAARVEKVEVDRGWKNAGPAEEVSKLRTKIKAEPAKVEARTPEPVKEAPAKDAPVAKPVESPVPPREPVVMPPKGPSDDKLPPRRPGADEKPEQPVPPTPPAADEKPERPVKPERGRGRPVPPRPDKPEPSPVPPKAEDKRPQPPVDKPAREESAPERKPKGSEAEPPRRMPRAPSDAETPNKRTLPPEPKKAEAEEKAPEAPKRPEPRPRPIRPEPREKTPPAATEPAPGKTANPGKGKGNTKEDRGDAKPGDEKKKEKKE